MKKITITILLALSTANLTYAAKCADFETQAEAQRFFDAGIPGSKRLDGDKDGEACECLIGGSGYHKSICKRWRKKNGKR